MPQLEIGSHHPGSSPTKQATALVISWPNELQYHTKFIPNLTTVLHPLNMLLKKDRKWKWSADCKKAFQQAKEAPISSHVLVHFDPSRPIELAADASAYSVGARISHTLRDGSELPIAFASRMLFTLENNYVQIEKEVLALIFGVQQFDQYFFG